MLVSVVNVQWIIILYIIINNKDVSNKCYKLDEVTWKSEDVLIPESNMTSMLECDILINISKISDNSIN